MRVVVVGATGNIGTSLIEALGADPGVTSVLGLARRRPDWSPPKTEWATADVRTAELAPHFRGADVVVHLAWVFQPTHDAVATWRVNVGGSLRVFAAVAAAGVPALVYSSSVAAYSPGPQRPQDRPVDESWPTHGWPGAAYGREKAYVERVLDTFDRDHPDVRVVRIRPAFIFKRDSAQQQRQLFIGPLVPRRLLRPGLLPYAPDIPGLRFQALHGVDAGDAFRRAVRSDVRGALNIAADPVVDAAVLAELLDAKPVRLPAWAVRSALAVGWSLRLVPASPGLFDAFLRLPVLDVGRARAELGWSATRSSVDALRDFLDGLRDAAGAPTPPLADRASRAG